MNAFIDVWSASLKSLGEVSKGYVDRQRVADDGAAIADYLLTMMIRAIDYTPPVNMEFCDFLSAVLTSDMEINPSDARFKFRETLRKSFVAYGIRPAAGGTPEEPGTWDPASTALRYDRTHFESMQRDPEEVFRFIWENRRTLGLYEDAYSRVLSVRPCLRIGPDGFPLHETVAEYIQILDLLASELKGLQVAVPEGMKPDQEVRMYGGGALVFDEYGRLKYHVRNRLNDRERQTQRLKYLWQYGYFSRGASARRSFAAMHRQRAMAGINRGSEEW